MDLKELKKIANYCKKNGIKSYKSGDVHIEFQESIQLPRLLKPVQLPNPISEEPKRDKPPEVTLEQINDYIYGGNEELN